MNGIFRQTKMGIEFIGIGEWDAFVKNYFNNVKGCKGWENATLERTDAWLKKQMYFEKKVEVFN